MRRVIYGFVIATAFIFLTACGQTASSVTDTPTPTRVTRTPTLTPTATLRSFFPTSTDVPTPTRFLTHTPTSVPTDTLVPTITQIPSPTPIGDFVSASPSREWAVWKTDAHDYDLLKFTTIYGVQWTVGPEDFGVREDAWFDSRIEFVRWSADEESVYIVMVPFSMYMRFFEVIGIVQLSLVDGSITFLVKPNRLSGSSTHSFYQRYRYDFSNDGKQLAYMWQDGESLELRLLNIETGRIQKRSMNGFRENSEFGDIAWSPDDQQIVFSISEHEMRVEPIDDFSVYLLTAEGKLVKRIYSHGEFSLWDVRWISDHEVKYHCSQLDVGYGEVIFDIETGEMTILN